ncbi:MAG: FtsQ-type POTRA domain-containing protein [Rubritalea sp.]|uniref:cell division protein FtsQ/DivIB n=1 Tax=Rubritalea sp. TaxID=2109375 RepID=UPI0032425B71
MFRKKQANTRYVRQRSDRMLHLQVSSPRIVFFQSRKAIWNIFKIAMVLAILGATGLYGISYVQNHFLTSPEFALRHLELKTNGFLNESEVAQIAEIDPSGTIFSFNIDLAEARLIARPEVVAAVVERRLPDTVKITLTERVPVAWIACPKLGMAGRNPLSGMLVDADGVIFTCQGSLWDVARNLPVIDISEADTHEFPLGEKMINKDAARALSLISLVNDVVKGEWTVKRVAVANFYMLVMTSNDNVEATFGMYEHKRQLNDLIAARNHAIETGRELEWINLLPKHNIPGNFKDLSSQSNDGLTSVND